MFWRAAGQLTEWELRMRYAALKPFSEPARSDSWDVFTKDITLTHTLD